MPIFLFSYFSFDCAYFSQKSDWSKKTLITKPFLIVNSPLRKIPAENWKHCSVVRTLFPPLPKMRTTIGLDLCLSHFCHMTQRAHVAQLCTCAWVNFPESLPYFSSTILNAHIPLFSKNYASIICQGLHVAFYGIPIFHNFLVYTHSENIFWQQ